MANSDGSERNPRKLEIALVGAGVCGLTCALALAKYGTTVQVFEAASKFEEIGAGIGLGPNALRVLQKIGAIDSILAHATEPEPKQRGFIVYSGLEGHELIYRYPTGPKDTGLGMHRASFLNALVELVDQRNVHFNKRCTTVQASPTNPARYVLHFTDGTTHEADVVLGADGIKSSVRSAVTRDDRSRVTFSNTVAYRGLVPTEILIAAGVKTDLTSRPVCFVGPGNHFILFPIKNGAVINIVIFSANHDIPIGASDLPADTPWVVPSSVDEIMSEFEGWGPDVTAIINCLKSPSKWYIHVVHPALETYAKGRVALLGDAAHAMLPHLGAGAGMGLEDAYLVARLLSHPQTTASNVEEVLQAYEHNRRPRAQMVWNASFKAGEVYDGYGPHKMDLNGIRADLTGAFLPVWDHDMEWQVETAVDWLQEVGAYH